MTLSITGPIILLIESFKTFGLFHLYPLFYCNNSTSFKNSIYFV